MGFVVSFVSFPSVVLWCGVVWCGVDVRVGVWSEVEDSDNVLGLSHWGGAEILLRYREDGAEAEKHDTPLHLG